MGLMLRRLSETRQPVPPSEYSASNRAVKLANPDRRRYHPTLQVGAIIALSMTTVGTAERLEETRSTESLTPRYESVIRLAEAIGSHRDQHDLFQILANELREVVAFDAL